VIRRVLDHLAGLALRVLLVIALLAVAWWWFAIYDTAKGKCERGDLGACAVYESQQVR